MRAVLDQAASVDGDDPVGAADGGEAMGDDEHGAALRDALHVLLDDPLALIVERAGRLVEDEDARIGHQRAGDGEALALAAREAAAALADHGVVAIRQFEDEFMRARELGRGNDRLDGHGGIGQGDVVADRTVEEHALLQHDADLTAQPGRVDDAEVEAVDEHAAALRHIEALHELRQRALAGPGRADDADDLPGRNVEVDVAQHLGAVDPVAKGHMLQRHLAAQRRQGGLAGTVGRLRARVENVAEAFDRDARLVEVLPDLGEPQHRRADAPGEDVEGDELADGQIVVHDQPRTEKEHRSGHQLVDELDELAGRVGEAQHAEARGHIGGKLIFPATLHLRLDRHGLQRLDAPDRLDQEGLVLGATPELLVESAAKQRRRERRDADVEGKRSQHHEGQQRRIDEHDAKEDEGEEKVDDEGERRTGDEAADVLQFAHARHGVADTPGLEIGERQREQMAEEAGAELDVDPVGGVREDIGSQDAEHGLEDRNGDEADDQHVERAEAAVHEHLVDHDLEEQGRDQAEELEEEGRDENARQHLAIFVDRPHEPADVEAARQVEQAGPAGHEDHLAVPLRLELRPGDEGGPRLVRGLDDRLVLADLGEIDELAILHDGDARQGRLQQARPARRHEMRLEAALATAAQDLGDSDGRLAVPMPDLQRVRAHAMKAQEENQDRQSRIDTAQVLGLHKAMLRKTSRHRAQRPGNRFILTQLRGGGQSASRYRVKPIRPRGAQREPPSL